MANSSTLTENKRNSVILNVIKGAFWGVAFSLVCVLIFAFIIKFTSISESAIQPVNQVIKGASILFACFIVGKKIKQNGWLIGLLTGLLYTVLSFLIFSILDGQFTFGLNVLNDVIFGSIMGLIAGIICIGLRKK